ncbi:hypothetical protein L3Q82_014727, partial [Scortum barcoo]
PRFKVTPQHLNGIKIRALTGPFQDSPLLSFQPVLGGFTGNGNESPEHRPAHLQLPLPARPLTTINTSTISGALTPPMQLAAWVTNYLTDRPQFVRLQDCVSDVVVCSTGAPQGTVLSPFLFTLYTFGLHILHGQLLTSRSSPMTLPLWDVCQRGTTSLKLRAPRSLNHFRPVALTSHLMKALERIVLRHLRPLVSPNMDPLQFAYQPSIGVDDAVIYLLQRSLSHLEDAGNTVRITFFDFSSAFNTIHPSLLRVKLERAGASDQLAAWVTNYLTDRPQFVRLQDCVSDVVVCSTLVPPREQSSHLSSSPCTHQTSRTPRTVATSRSSPMTLPLWDVSGNPQLTLHQLNIQGLDIERVRTYKYLGVHLNNKLAWTDNTDSLYKRGQSRLYMLRRLGSFGVCRPLLRTFYETVVASVVSYAVVCWGGGCSERDKKRLNRLIKRASSVCGCPLDSIEVMGERRALAKLSTVHHGQHLPPSASDCGGLKQLLQQQTQTPKV